MSKYWIDYDHPTGAALMRDKTVLVDNILAGIGGDGVTSVLNRETIALGNELFAMTKDRDEWKAATIDANKRFAAAEAGLEAENARLDEQNTFLHARVTEYEIENKILNFRLESLLQETCIVDEETGEVYEDGFLNPDLVADLIASTILNVKTIEPKCPECDGVVDSNEDELLCEKCLGLEQEEVE